jgi:hypothetical protein
LGFFVYMATKPKHPGGRPSKYQAVYAKQAYQLTLLGATDKEMAEFFCVNQDTIYEWQSKHPQFSESIKKGKLQADAEVANKLYDRALGAEWTEQQAFKIRNQTATGVFTEDVKIVDVRRAAPPDTQAISLWLRNRQPDKWRDKQEHEHAGKGGDPIRFTLAIGSPDAKGD